MNPAKPKHIVIVGGGFAGLNLVKELAKDRRFKITLVDKNNYNQFTPLVYQVGTGFLEPSNISYPFRKYLRNKENARFQLGEVTSVKPEEHLVNIGEKSLQYDYLVLATGSISNFFGNQVLEQKAIALKTVEDAIVMRNQLIESLEEASDSTDPEALAGLLTIVIAGAGPTGVEVAGMLAEMRKKIIKKDYPDLDMSGARIYLVDGTATVLNQMSQSSSKDAQQILEKLGVEIILNSFITSFEEGAVHLSTGEQIPTRNLIWAAGVTGKIIRGLPQSSYGKNKRILVDCFSAVLGVSDIYAVGDNCLLTTDSNFPNGHAQLAQPAIQQGTKLGKNLTAIAARKPPIPFRYIDRGVMAVIGKNNAVVDITKPRLHLKNLSGLLIWLFTHVASLISWSGKLKTLANWIITYVSGDQSLRLVIKGSFKIEPNNRDSNEKKDHL